MKRLALAVTPMATVATVRGELPLCDDVGGSAPSTAAPTTSSTLPR
jgi:hypothetical protein